MLVTAWTFFCWFCPSPLYSSLHCCCCGVVFVVKPKFKAKNFSKKKSVTKSNGHLISNSTGDLRQTIPDSLHTSPCPF